MRQIFTFLLIICSTPLFAQVYCYRDLDEDGYGDPANKTLSTQVGCPPGYVSNSDDCDDKDNKIHTFVWYRDLDNDGYYDGSDPVESCTKPDGYRSILFSNEIDCDDHDANVYPIKWYADHDNDGYGLAADWYVTSCTPSGWNLCSSRKSFKRV